MPLRVRWETKKQHSGRDGRLETFGPRRGDSSRVSLYLRDTAGGRNEPFLLKWSIRVPFFLKSSGKTAYANPTLEPAEIRDSLARLAEMIRFCNEQFRFRSTIAKQLTTLETLLAYAIERYDQLESEERTPQSPNGSNKQQ